MIHKFVARFLHIFVFSLSCQLHYFPALCDITIKNESSKQIEFAVGSDFVQTGCGSFIHPAYLILSNPLDACEVPKKPPTTKHVVENHQFVLLAAGNKSDGHVSARNCDFKTKFKNAAEAVYSGIIIGTLDFHEEIVFPGLITDDDEEFIDVHLINPPDIKPLSKYAYPNPFQVIPPVRHRCKEEYQKRWLRSRYVSQVLRRGKQIKLSLFASLTNLSNLFRQASTGHINSILRKASDSTETLLYWGCVVVVPLSPLFLAYLLLFSENFSYKTFSKEVHNQKFGGAFTTGDQNAYADKDNQRTDYNNTFSKNNQKKENPSSASTSTNDEDQKKQQNAFDDRDRKREQRYTAPPRPPSVTVDYTLYHRINLGIRISTVLTKAEVNSAYRKFALSLHPDKHRHLDIKQIDKTTEEFRSKTKSRDVLLTYCKE